MPSPWSRLLRAAGRHLLVVAAVLAVLLAPVAAECLPCDGQAEAAEAALGLDSGAGDPADPGPCDHCHCSAPAALVADHAVRLPIAAAGRDVVRAAPVQVPDDPVFVPDPPPNKA